MSFEEGNHIMKLSGSCEYIVLNDTLPVGTRKEDHTSSDSSGVGGGQLITGARTLPDKTGPRPLLRPATATKTTGASFPEKWKRSFSMMRINNFKQL